MNSPAPPPLPSNQNLVRVGSAILAPDTRAHWELIQHTERGTAALLRHFEDYANTLAQNMRKTYLSPFTIVTPHIGGLLLLFFCFIPLKMSHEYVCVCVGWVFRVSGSQCKPDRH